MSKNTPQKNIICLQQWFSSMKKYHTAKVWRSDKVGKLSSVNVHLTNKGIK